MNHSSFAIEATLLLCLAGCGPVPDGGGSTSDASVAGTTTGAETSSPASSSSATSMTATDGSTTTTSTNESQTSDSTAPSEDSTSGTGELSVPELCRAAATQAECDAAADSCSWRAAYRVLDVDRCALEPAPDLQCWAIESSQCFAGQPDACIGLDVDPRYREIDGELQLLDFPCQQGPAEVESDPTFWEICNNEELGPIPPVCNCLCGGPPGK